MMSGYALVSPYLYGKKYYFMTGSDFDEYLHAKKYQDLVNDSRGSYRWAFNDCIGKFIIQDVPDAWKINLRMAADRTEKRVFGWWFSYP